MKRILCLSLVIMLGAIAGFSDIARPPEPKAPKQKGLDATLQISMRSNVSVATLSVPKAQIKSLRAQLDELDADSDNTASVTSFSRIQTIASGSLLSLALVFGGVWFVRSGKTAGKGGKAALAIFVTLGIASAATLVFANVGPPPVARSITGKLFDQKAFEPYGFASGKIKVVVDSGTKNVYSLEVPNPAEPRNSEE